MRTRRLIVVLALLLHGCGKGGGEPVTVPASATYVGAEACRSCHAEVWSTFSRTGMGRSFYPLTADRIIEDWTENNSFTSPRSGLRYRMERRDGRFYMRQFL